MNEAALREVVAAVERLIARDEVSSARARQLRWVARELGRALDEPTFPDASRGALADLLGPEGVAAYLRLAARGVLRSRSVTAPDRPSEASMRIRADCLRLIAREARCPDPLPDRAPMPALAEAVHGWQQGVLWERLRNHADRAPGDASRARLVALIGVVLDTGTRAGELTAMTVDDLAADLSTLRVTRRPQARSSSPPRTEVLGLSGQTRAALRRWLAVRRELVAAVQGGKRALWVSVRSNHSGTLTDGRPLARPPGMPLQPRGLARAYTRAVDELNAALVGSPGWRPLPRRMEQLRRGIPQSRFVQSRGE